MNRLLLATAASALIAGAAAAQDPVNVGIILGFTGPLESITPGMAAGAEMAIKEVNDSGKFAHGMVAPVRADSTLLVPTRSSVCRICRCRFERSTTSWSMIPSLPTPAAAR